MEESELIFDLPAITFPEIKHVAKFDKETGKVISVGPRLADSFLDDEIEIDKEMFDDIFSGKINLHHCFIDFYDNKLQVKYNQILRKIDDVLHRIVEEQFVKIDDPEIFLTYNRSLKKLTIELTERFYGSRKVENTKNLRKQRVLWSGDTEMDFYITEYNDPHFVFKKISIKLLELEDKKVEIDCEINNRFSIFTRRLFKNYILEII
jgi:hypothetical protein